MNEERGAREYRAHRPYTYHYDGAIFDGPDQYVNIVLSSDGVLQSEVLEDDEENIADDLEEEGAGQTPAPPTSNPSPLNRPPAGGVDSSATYQRQASYLAEPRGYIQVTHATKNRSDARVTVSRSVPELLETLPSLEEPVIHPVPCESEIYDKWARLPRTDTDVRGSARSVTVTAKGWTILQSMQNAGQSGPAAAAPANNNPVLTAMADEECTSLDSIIDHYNQMHLVQSGNYTPAVLKPGPSDARRVSEDDSASKAPGNRSGRRSPQILNPLLKKAPTTNPSSLGVSEPSSQHSSPQVTKKATPQPIPAATASLDWPSDMNNSDKLYQMSRFWSWRPSKTSVKLQKTYPKPSPNQLEKLEKNQKAPKKDKVNSKANIKKTGPNAATSDNFLATSDVKTRPAAAAAARTNNQPTTHFNDNIDDVISTSRPRFLNLKGNSYNAAGESAHPVARNDNATSAGQRGVSDVLLLGSRNSDNFLKAEADGGRSKPSTRSGANKFSKQTSALQSKASPQPRYRPKLARTADTGDFKSLVQRSAANDTDLSQVQFLDLTDLNLGQTSRNRQKLQKEDFRNLTFSLRGKSSDPKSVN